MSARPVDIFEAYDLAMRQTFVGLCSGVLEHTVNVITSPVDRAMIEAKTVLQSGQSRPNLPLVSLYAGENIEFPGDRQSTAVIRNLGYSKAQQQTKLLRRTARMPMLARIPYTADIWTETAREAHLLIQKLVFLTGRGYAWLSVHAGDPWGWKKATLLFGNAVVNTTNLESAERFGERLVRFTLPYYLEGWIFDNTLVEKQVARNIIIKFFDWGTQNEIERIYSPRRHPLGTGDGANKNFSDTFGMHLQTYSVLVTGTVGGLTVTGFDDGAGVISGTGITGTVNYTTGAVAVTFTTAPDADTPVEAGFFTEA
ncbi:MAG: hypothetical protein A2Y38_13245 [Spirochaetes bacterium GWB1_59_5]|nr:MAG: hypothetical protein A2Y38_13245 [Spirochaetes bacterium GWB1_59_5]